MAQLASATGLTHPTTHRFAVAPEYHRMVARDMWGHFAPGPRLQEFASSVGEDRLLAASIPVLQALRGHTRESSQLFCCQGDYRVCVAASGRETGLRGSIPVGATLSIAAGFAAQVLPAWERPDRLYRGLYGASFDTMILSQVRRRDWAQPIGEHEPGVASVSVPVCGLSGRVLAASSTLDPIERMDRQPGHQYGPSVIAAMSRLSGFLRSVEDPDLQTPLDFRR